MAGGFEELEVSELQKDSPTVASGSLRLPLAVVIKDSGLFVLRTEDLRYKV